jgi:hypothetical protein
MRERHCRCAAWRARASAVAAGRRLSSTIVAFAAASWLAPALHAAPQGGLGLAPRRPDAAEPLAALPPEQLVATTDVQPIAVRGGVMLLPMARRDTSRAWPETMQLTLGDGRTLRGTTAVVRPRARKAATHWTTPLISVGADPASEATAAEDVVLLVPLPPDGEDHIELGAQRIDPDWIDPLPGAQALETVAPAEGEPHLPDLDAPSEHFRWHLLAARVGEPIPEPRGSALDALYAHHLASLWSGAIERLRHADPDVARELLADLTGRACVPDGGCIAAWATDFRELNALLESLLDPDADGIALVESARRWMTTRPPVVAWVEGEDDDGVMLRIANPRPQTVDVSLRWPDRKDPSQQVTLEPETVHMVRLQRDSTEVAELPEEVVRVLEEQDLGHLAPPQVDPGREAVRRAVERSARAIPNVLLESGEWSLTIPIGTVRAAARPPALALGAFLPRASLAEIRAGTVRAAPAELATTAQLRRRPSGWELLVDCRRDGEPSPSDVVTLVVDAGWRREIQFGEMGAVGDADGAVVRTASGPRGWRARVALPRDWIRAAHGTLSLERKLPDGQVVSAGVAPPAWSPEARPLPVSFDAWTAAPAPTGAPATATLEP